MTFPDTLLKYLNFSKKQLKNYAVMYNIYVCDYGWDLNWRINLMTAYRS
jgi:hypothetical protein